MSYNAGLLYYRHYYKGIDFSKPEKESEKKAIEKKNLEFFEAKNQQLFQQKLGEATRAYTRPDFATQTLDMTTSYPGLTIGTGYAHGSGLLGELKIGFFFDHTTGLPVIPGSSVKGLLRSAFPGPYRHAAQKYQARNDEKMTARLLKKAAAVEKFIQNLLNAITGEPKDAAFVQALEDETFGKIDSTGNGIPMAARDVFYDAFPVKSENNSRTTKYGAMPADSFLADDFITPHINRKNKALSPFTNPTPIAFLKVLPGVTFQFQFDLKADFVDANGQKQNRKLTADQRKRLFEAILTMIGAGAKTNVGYGQFWSPEAEQVAGQSAQTSPAKGLAAIPDPIPVEAVKRNKTVYAEVTDNRNGQLQLRLLITGYDKLTTIRYSASDRFALGAIVSVVVRDVQGKADKLNIVISPPML